MFVESFWFRSSFRRRGAFGKSRATRCQTSSLRRRLATPKTSKKRFIFCCWESKFVCAKGRGQYVREAMGNTFERPWAVWHNRPSSSTDHRTRPSDAISIESKGLSNRSNPTLAEIFAENKNKKLKMQLFGKFSWTLLDTFELEFDSNKSWDDRLNSLKSGKNKKCNFLAS